MIKVLKIAAVVMVAGFVVLQFFRPDRTNPPIVEGQELQAFAALPEDVKAVISRSCNDCHSHNTVYPWYSNVSPFSWFLADHIETGRSRLNFSVWNTYSADKKRKKLDEICEQIELKFMPLPSYLWIHGDAVLSEPDGKLLCEWAMQEKERIAHSPQTNFNAI